MRGSGPKPSRRRHEKRRLRTLSAGAITRTDNASGPAPGTPETLGEWAAHYAAAGLEVFPVDPARPTGPRYGALRPKRAPIGHQRPRTQSGDGGQPGPTHSIGCRIPENVVVFDIDPRHDGHDTWDTIVAGHDLSVTRRHASGRNDGGFHIWFRNPNGHELKDRDGIDVLHHGHRYSILPPSLHPETGQPYTWVHDPKTPMADLPEWLAEALTPATVAQAATKAPTIASNNAYHDGGPTPAEWYNDNASWSEILIGWRLVFGNGEDDGSKWAHPTATAAFSATIRHGCLFVYSPTPGLPVTETNDPNGLTKFRAEALLNYNGDMAACARDIRSIMPDRITGEIPTTPQPLIVPDAVTTDAGTSPVLKGPGNYTNEFWETTPLLAQIRQAAWASYDAPAATLAALLARATAADPPISPCGRHRPGQREHIQKRRLTQPDYRDRGHLRRR